MQNINYACKALDSLLLSWGHVFINNFAVKEEVDQIINEL